MVNISEENKQDFQHLNILEIINFKEGKVVSFKKS